MTVYRHAKFFSHESSVSDKTLLEAGVREDLLRQIGGETKNFIFCLSSFLSHDLLTVLSGAETGIIVTTNLGAMEYYETFWEGILTNDVQPTAFKAAIPNFTASAVALQFGLKGPTITMVDEQPFSLKSLFLGRHLIESGWCDHVVAGGFSAASKTRRLLCGATRGSTTGYWALLLSREDILGGSSGVDCATDTGDTDIRALFPSFQAIGGA